MQFADFNPISKSLFFLNLEACLKLEFRNLIVSIGWFSCL